MYSLFIVCLAVLTGFFAYGMLFGVKQNEKFWKQIPREKVLGSIIGCIALYWSAYELSFMLEGGLAGLKRHLPYIPLIITILSWYMLDFILTRALGGIILLLAVGAMHQAMCMHVPGREALSAVCYIVGFVAMFMVGTPWRLREFIKLAGDKDDKARIAGYVSGVFSISFVLFLIIGLVAR